MTGTSLYGIGSKLELKGLKDEHFFVFQMGTQETQKKLQNWLSSRSSVILCAHMIEAAQTKLQLQFL